MSQLFYIHPDNPQPRLISQCVEVLRKGGVIVYPTDSGYALGCMLGEKTLWSGSVVFVIWTAIIISRWCAAICQRFPPTRLWITPRSA